MLVSKTMTIDMIDLVEIQKFVEENIFSSVSDFIRKAVRKEIVQIKAERINYE